MIIVRVLAALASALFLAVAPSWAATGEGGAGGSVLLTRVDDAITPVIADHLVDALAEAEAGGHEALVVEIDTPGGLDSSMREVVQAFLAAEVPVVVHVTPQGARAASAGALISWSAHIVAMAPGTTIGAATPVDLQGGEVGDKVVNDAAAYARAIAEERGRDVDVVAAAVTEGRALSATEAVEAGVADLVVTGRPALLDELDGREVSVRGEAVTLRTAGVAVEEEELSFFRRVLQFLADPNVAFLFMSLGTLGVIYEFATPGIGLAGGAGVVLILLSLFGLAVLPIDAIGFVFLILAGALFVAELFAPGIGVAAGFGAISLALAGVFLFREETPGLSLSLAAVVPTVAVVGGAVVLAGRLALRARRGPTRSGVSTLIGREIEVARATDAKGQAIVEGAWWNLRSHRPLRPGERVRVCEVEGLDLIVEPTVAAKAREEQHE